jgi:translocation and assembly module TamA
VSRRPSGRRSLRLGVGALALLAALAARAAALQVEITGVSGELRDNVQAFLSIYRERESSELTEARVQRLHARAEDEIRQALAPFGLYRVGVRAELTGSEGGWLARYEVDPGPPVPVGQVEVRVTGDGAGEAGLPTPGLQPGAPFTHPAYEADKRALRNALQARGYLEARYERSEVLVDLEAYRADVFLEIETGPRFYVGPVRFAPDGFDEDFLARFVGFEQGEPLRYADLLDLQVALRNTDYFSEVEVTPRLEEASDQRVPVDVRVVRTKRDRYRVGVGYETDVGPRVSTDWIRRYLGSQGHSARTLLSLAPAAQRLEAEYRIPLEDPRKEFFALQASAENYDTTSRETSILSLRGSRTDFHGDWQRVLGLDYDFESPRTEGDDPYYTLVPNVAWIWKVHDDPVYTRRGFRVDAVVLGATEPVLSNATFLQGRVRARGIYSPFDGWRVLARGEVGASIASSVREVPLSRRFYAGGDYSVRGYGFEELSPEDAEGEPTGGRHLVTASLELERRLSEHWFAAAFYDTGNAFDDFSEFELYRGAGLGVRWLSPVGLIRVDVAKALDDDGYRLHLVIGPDL